MLTSVEGVYRNGKVELPELIGRKEFRMSSFLPPAGYG